MPKHPEPATELDDADLDHADGGAPMLLPAVESVPELLFSTGDTSTATDGSGKIDKYEQTAKHLIQPLYR